MTNLLKITVFLALLGFGCWWQMYAYRDCLSVGHSRFYCVMRFGR